MSEKQKETKKQKVELTIVTESWNDLRKLYYGEHQNYPELNFSLPKESETGWIFRAEKIDQNLQTHLEQAFDKYGIFLDGEKTEREKEILREFQRKAAHYVDHEPHKDNILEWLALMRHYGAPTRLMDWTYSFFIAVYFALAENDNGVVRALDAGKLKLNKAEVVIDEIKKTEHKERFYEFRDKLSKMDDILQLRSVGCKLYDLAIISCFLENNPISTVYAVNPFRLNPRLTIQQGLFLAPGNIHKSFRQNLSKRIGDENESKKNLHKIEINVNKDERKEIIRQLHGMNISNAVLFPDLGGFAKSLEESMARTLVMDRCDKIKTG